MAELKAREEEEVMVSGMFVVVPESSGSQCRAAGTAGGAGARGKKERLRCAKGPQLGMGTTGGRGYQVTSPVLA